MAVLCLLSNTPWPWPTPSRAASAGCGKSGFQASRRPEEANTWSCTEFFPSPCARQERRSSERFGFLARRGARDIAFAFQPIRGGVAGRNRPAGGGERRTLASMGAAARGGFPSPNKATWSVASQVIPFNCANCARHSFVCDGCPVE
jgi:hypothetical protein